MRMRWRMKHSKKDQAGGQEFEKTLLVDPERNAISTGMAITKMYTPKR